jgi:hypothetical protein
MSKPYGSRITYRQHPDAKLEEEREALARVYRYVLECGEKRRAIEAEKVGEDPEDRAATGR